MITLLSITIVVFLVALIFEDQLKIDKAYLALSMLGITQIIVYAYNGANETINLQLEHNFGENALLMAYLLLSMKMAMIMEKHKSFLPIAKAIKTENPVKLLLIFVGIAYVLGYLLNNLAGAMFALLILHQNNFDSQKRRLIGAAIVIATNAGTVPSVGGFTTFLLWRSEKVSLPHLHTYPLLGSIVCAIIAIGIYYILLRKEMKRHGHVMSDRDNSGTHHLNVTPEIWVMLIGGTLSIILGPVLAVLFSFNIIVGTIIGFVVTGVLSSKFVDRTSKLQTIKSHPKLTGSDLVGKINHEQEHARRTVLGQVKSNTDSMLAIFLFAMLSVAGIMEQTGMLEAMGHWLVSFSGGSESIISSMVGLSSAILDNGMEAKALPGIFPGEVSDSLLWQMCTYALATGGSILSIGSLAGLIFLFLEKGTNVIWYLRYVATPAAISFFGGLLAISITWYIRH